MLMRIFVAGSFATLAMAGPAAAQMDCDAMFRQAEQALAAHPDTAVEDRVELYQKAVEAYEACEGDESSEDEAARMFREIFETTGRM